MAFERIKALRERLKQRFSAAEYDELCRLQADEAKAQAATAAVVVAKVAEPPVIEKPAAKKGGWKDSEPPQAP